MTTDQGGGLGGLFDFELKQYITPTVLKVIYILGLVTIALFWLFFVVAGSARGTGGFVGAFVLGSLFSVLWLLFLRVGVELIMVTFRIADNTDRMVEALERGASS